MKNIMTKPLFIFAFLIVLPLCLLQAQTEEEKAVQKCFDEYKEKMLADDGEGAVALVSNSTIAYYQQVLEWVLTASEKEVKALGLLDRLSVLTMRARIAPELLRELDGAKLLAYSYENGMVSKNAFDSGGLGDVSVDEDTARAPLVLNGEEAPFDFIFIKEDGEWKFDMMSLITHPMIKEGLENAIQSMGDDENEVIIEVIKMSTDMPVTKKVWKPVGR